MGTFQGYNFFNVWTSKISNFVRDCLIFLNNILGHFHCKRIFWKFNGLTVNNSFILTAGGKHSLTFSMGPHCHIWNFIHIYTRVISITSGQWDNERNRSPKYWSPKTLVTKNIVHQKHCSPKTKKVVTKSHCSGRHRWIYPDWLPRTSPGGERNK